MVGLGIVTLGVQPGACSATWRFRYSKSARWMSATWRRVDDLDHRRGQFFAAVGPLYQHRDVGFHATELLQEVDVEVGAAKLAVGDAGQATVALELHDFGDGAVFHRAQLPGVDLADRLLLARLQQVGRAQEAADVVSAERWAAAWGQALGHRFSLA